MIHVAKDVSSANIGLSDLELENIVKCIKMFVSKFETQYAKLNKYKISYKNLKEIYDDIVKNIANRFRDAISYAIKITANFLKSKELKVKPKLAFTKLLGDLYCKKFNLLGSSDSLENAQKNYESCLALVNDSGIEESDPVLLTFYLNYSNFLAGKMSKKEEAIKISKMALERVTSKGIELKEKSQTDILFLCQLIKDNLALWKSEVILTNNKMILPGQFVSKARGNNPDDKRNLLNNNIEFVANLVHNKPK
mmetsp:Transcript_655/g.652  ORF Transcript_655/g.652 Transcript_655/m.652 type:complete len:252 (+) Transcript_655:164-919(+)|eukprot:CAMPEP_0170530202 /NCGR_PEP_ID=MMETSP0209-20121228/42869_1 /TAXON_ID=665100 ORGANISM="Litonotus pictus, Strain P1" /NCGR_SAMPLE_ID=MMETSP0209 /ASSEMBLY_ACC=CAM_ASM_000301 /LENGTH=251 /DNA_ID=CAMNT_0010823045 /DNA_START=76 /DNA_END=831 /DNA_ORIENTATION=+